MDKSLFLRGIEEILPSKDSFLNKIESEKITTYLGIDPTSPDIHIGNAVALWKLRMLQDEGHKVILLFGDFTARMGDPSDKMETRKLLPKEEILENAKTYADQAAKILNFSGENPAQIKFNSEWLEDLKFSDVIEIASHFTVSQMLERDLFQKRMSEGKPIGLHEFLYPLLQGYDSVAMEPDAEIGGTDQTFNMLSGRSLLKDYKNKEKFVITVTLLLGTDGRKMSKSYGNSINLTDSPSDMYGKVMSLSDNLLLPYFELATKLSNQEIDDALNKPPIETKKLLAFEITSLYHGENKAHEAQENFKSIIQDKKIPRNMEVFKFATQPTVVEALVKSGIASSNSEAKRQVNEGSVDIHVENRTEKVLDPFWSLVNGTVVQQGSRNFFRVEVGDENI